MPENVFAIGNFIRTNQIDGWVKERLTGLNSHVRFVHNKFMLIDPLSDDPIVVGGSANFSDASTRRNDENMVITRGNTRVADIYLGEFMRLYSHHAFRESLTFDNPQPPKPLRTDDWWGEYFGRYAAVDEEEVFCAGGELDPSHLLAEARIEPPTRGFSTAAMQNINQKNQQVKTSIVPSAPVNCIQLQLVR